MVSNTIFFRIFMVRASENDFKIEVFSMFFRKWPFCKNHCFSKGKLLFFRFRASQKPLKFDAETHSKNTSKKNLPKIDFGLRFGFPKPPKIHPTSKKIEKQSLRKKPCKKDPRKSMGPNGRQAFWDPAGPSNYLSND